MSLTIEKCQSTYELKISILFTEVHNQRIFIIFWHIQSNFIQIYEEIFIKKEIKYNSFINTNVSMGEWGGRDPPVLEKSRLAPSKN